MECSCAIGPGIVAAIGMAKTSPITCNSADIPVVATEFQRLRGREDRRANTFYDGCHYDCPPPLKVPSPQLVAGHSLNRLIAPHIHIRDAFRCSMWSQLELG